MEEDNEVAEDEDDAMVLKMVCLVDGVVDVEIQIEKLKVQARE